MYNGHKNWAQWNVSQWINSDEGLYRLAKSYTRRNKRDDAARLILADLNDSGITHTPDGARYTKTAIKSAIVGY